VPTTADPEPRALWGHGAEHRAGAAGHDRTYNMTVPVVGDYQFAVQAINSAGASAPSTRSNPVASYREFLPTLHASVPLRVPISPLHDISRAPVLSQVAQ